MANAALFMPPAALRPGPPPLALEKGDRGPDVSSHQGDNIDWSRVARAGFKFAFIKATEGTDYTNPYFEADWSEVRAAGLLRGAYHFARPNDNGPEDEAAYFLSRVQADLSDLLILDIEDGDGDLGDWCRRWSLAVTASFGYLPWFYSGAPFMQSHGLTNVRVSVRFAGLWLADYREAVPQVPLAWKRITFWQYTDRESVDGVQSACDCSVYLP